MKKLNKVQKLGLALAFACIAAGAVHAEGVTDVLTPIKTDIMAVVDFVKQMALDIIAVASIIWLSILAYKRGRTVTKQTAG